MAHIASTHNRPISSIGEIIVTKQVGFFTPRIFQKKYAEDNIEITKTSRSLQVKMG